MIKVNKFQCWSLLMAIDFQINWRFEVNKPHKTKNRIFHWIREELLQTVSPKVSVKNLFKLFKTVDSCSMANL